VQEAYPKGMFFEYTGGSKSGPPKFIAPLERKFIVTASSTMAKR
jgi:hypothetical protein